MTMNNTKSLLFCALAATWSVGCIIIETPDEPDVSDASEEGSSGGNTTTDGSSSDGNTDDTDGTTSEGEDSAEGDGDGEGETEAETEAQTETEAPQECFGLGEVCNGNWEGCCEGTFCQPSMEYGDSLCEPMREDGEPCIISFECLSGICEEGVCGGVGCIDIGDECFPEGSACCEGYCNVFDYGPTVCSPLLEPGEFCVDGQQCISGQCTDNGVCA